MPIALWHPWPMVAVFYGVWSVLALAASAHWLAQAREQERRRLYRKARERLEISRYYGWRD